jgi:hypothetical protein
MMRIVKFALVHSVQPKPLAGHPLRNNDPEPDMRDAGARLVIGASVR